MTNAIANVNGMSVDEVIQGIVGIYETAFPDRIQGHYLLGSYAHRAAIPFSDLDLAVLFKGTFLHEEERTAHRVYQHCKSISPVPLDIKLYDENTLLHTDPDIAPLDYHVAKIACHRMAIKVGSVIIYGTDTRDQIQAPSPDMYMRGWLHNVSESCYGMHVVRGHADNVTVPFDYPDSDGEFYGYVVLGQTNLHSLVLHVSLLATALITLKAGVYVGHKTACPRLYGECVGDEWTPFVEEAFDVCRKQWQQRVPKNPGDRKRLRDICSDLLAFENHCMGILKDYLIAQLRSNDPAGRLAAAHWLGEIIYLTPAVLSALHDAESHDGNVLCSTVEETIRRIHTALGPTSVSYKGGEGSEVNVIEKLRPHHITLHGADITLRPLTEDDWEYLLVWEEGYLFPPTDGSEADHLREMQEHFRSGSQHAYIWIIEFKGKVIGYCTLYSGSGDDEIYADFAERDCRGVEIMIGRRDLWGQGIGTKVVQMVIEFAFERDSAEVLCVIDIGEFNLRGRRVLEKNGFEIYATRPVLPKGGTSDLYYVLTRDQYERMLIES